MILTCRSHQLVCHHQRFSSSSLSAKQISEQKMTISFKQEKSPKMSSQKFEIGRKMVEWTQNGF